MAAGSINREFLMTIDVRAARGKLGKMWGLKRPLTYTEMGRVLRLGGVRPDQSVRDYERGKTAVSGPLSLAIDLMLAGARPADLAEKLGGQTASTTSRTS